MAKGISGSLLLEQLQWRYAVKLFDETKKISDSDWALLEQALILTPSSYGLQPWKFIVITDQSVRKQLTDYSHKQKQVESCSHFVVLTRLRQLTEAHIDEYMKLISDIRGTAPEKLAGFKKVIVGDAIHGARSRVINEWLARQCYIALGNLMTSAALMGIDTCPMEGIDIAGFDKILNLESSEYQTVVTCAVGYRSPQDPLQKSKKVRYPSERIIQRI